MASEEQYKLSFTSGGMYLSEAVRLARLQLAEEDWVVTAARAREENLIQARTKATATRVIREVTRRLATLSSGELALLCDAEPCGQSVLVFVAVCRYYRFLCDFTLQVVRGNVLALMYVIDDVDYVRFVEEEELLHPELAKISDTSKAKIRQVTFRILAETGLIAASNDRRITPPAVPPPIVALLAKIARKTWPCACGRTVILRRRHDDMAASDTRQLDGEFEAVLAREASMPKERLLKLLQLGLDIERVLAPAMAEISAVPHDTVFITGVGLVYPFLRSHNILNNVQRVFKDHPMVMFFPGEYRHTPASGSTLNLFGRMTDDKYYRAFDLNEYSI